VKKFVLNESRLPRAWYNVAADLPGGLAPVLHPGTLQPIGPSDLAPLFPMAIIEQEVSTERFVTIPDEVRDALRLFRPTPLVRAERLERYLDTPAHIYFKNESVSPAGSHKTNTAIPQAWYNRREGIRKLVTETGAGQWGSALSFAGQLFGLEVEIYMVAVSYLQKPYRRSLMRAWGGEVHSSPSNRTASGRAVRAEHPDSPGSLGIAISEAVERAASDPLAHYALGSVLNHVLLHQTVTGIESMQQLAMAGDYPDLVIGCTGGGSNFAGLAFPFLGKQLREGGNIEFIAVEPSACPTLTKGLFAYDYGDTAHLTPLCKMFTLGSSFVPPGFHAGGLRYHGMAPQISHLAKLGYIAPRSYNQLECFAAGLQFAKAEGIIPAPEANHAVRAAIHEAEKCCESGEAKTILFNLCGHGHFDMQAYTDYLGGKLKDLVYAESEVALALAGLPSVG
jgi:tryptophan synthase beta chain